MTVIVSNLTVTATEKTRGGTQHFEVSTVTNEHGDEVPVTPGLLDEIEKVLEAEAQAAQWEDDYWNCEVPHLMHAYC